MATLDVLFAVFICLWVVSFAGILIGSIKPKLSLSFFILSLIFLFCAALVDGERGKYNGIEHSKKEYYLEIRESYSFGETDTTYVLLPRKSGFGTLEYDAEKYDMGIKETRFRGETDTTYVFKKKRQ